MYQKHASIELPNCTKGPSQKFAEAHETNNVRLGRWGSGEKSQFRLHNKFSQNVAYATCTHPCACTQTVDRARY